MKTVKKGGATNKFHGFLFSKLHSIGRKSEGPAYFLQQFDYSEIAINKQVPLWEQDPYLQGHLGSKITIDGKLVSGFLDYEEVRPYSS